MHKTLHEKLTDKQQFAFPQSSSPDETFMALRQEARILNALAKDILRPRQQAVANILKMAKDL